MKHFFITARLATIIGCTLLLMGCSWGGNEGEAKDAVRQHLKDPESVKFKDFVISKSGNYACVIWNARNSMGGYGEWEIAELKKIRSKWGVVRMSGSEDNCTQSHWNDLDIYDKTHP